MSEPLTQLAALPSAAPDRARAERIRVHCRTRLGRQVHRAAGPRNAASGYGARIWQPLAVVLGAGYMAEVIFQALRVYGIL